MPPEASLRHGCPRVGLSHDGRALEFKLQIVQVPNSRGEYWGWGSSNVRVLACAPDSGNDKPRFHPDCVSGADGFDASYDVIAEGGAISDKKSDASRSYTDASPYSAALLLDQSAHVIVDDSGNSRLFAAKYFLTYATENDPKLIAAFASDDASTTRYSLLPQTPVSISPAREPAVHARRPKLLSGGG